MSRSTSNRSSNSNGSSGTEMYEFICTTSNEDNLNTIQRTESNLSNDSLTNRSHLRQLLSHAPFSTIQHRHVIPMHHQLSCLKKKLKSTRNKLINNNYNNNNNNQEKNKGYLMVEKINSDFILLPNDNIDQEVTQNPQSGVQTNEITLATNSIEYLSTISNTNDLLETQQSLFRPCTTSIDNCLIDRFKDLSTQLNVEFDVPIDDLLNIYDTQISETLSTQSLLSTHDSNREYTRINRSLLSDSEYIRAQRLDLESLVLLEIDASNERCSLQEDPDDESEFNRLYDEALAKNSKLKQELKTLQEKYELINSSWLCEFCTWVNEPYIKTLHDTCAVCESPSPYKRAMLST